MIDLTLTNDPNTTLISIDYNTGSLIYANLDTADKLVVDTFITLVNDCMESDNYNLSINAVDVNTLNLVYDSGSTPDSEFHSLADINNDIDKSVIDDMFEIINR